AGGSPFSMQAGDLDRDGDVDLVTANTASGDVSVLINDGAARFLQSASYPAGHFPVSLKSADLDGDGYLDLAMKDVFTEDITVLFQKGGGTFHLALSFFAEGGLAPIVEAGDLDGDRDIDLAFLKVTDPSGVPNTISVLFNDGHGRFPTKEPLSVG